tara:strand:- start:9133 stop:9867 length:735 start_codon:yes stop_codon:yes gene_type:complete
MLPNFLNKFSKEIDGVIHVGAHIGQEFVHYNKHNFDKVLFFEPQKDIFKRLINNVENYDNVECYNFALGSMEENKVIYKSQGNQGLSSSVLPPELHLEVQPDISFLDTEEIEIKRFDSLDVDILNFLTLDVQGLELEVLKGFGEALNKVEFIFTEINTKYLYKDNALVGDIDAYLKGFNFVRVFTNIDCFNYFGDAFYIKKTNKIYKKKFLEKIINQINISNYYLHIKKLIYPKKLVKSIIKKI